MLVNKGGYFYYNDESKYRGLYFPERKDNDNWTLFKTIDAVNFNAEDKAIINRFNSYERLTDKGAVRYFFVRNSLVMETEIKGDIDFTLDMRELYDFDDKGRIYNIYYEKGCIIVEYKKYWDTVLENIHYTRYLSIKSSITNFEKILQWQEKNYSEDEKRKSYPWKLYVFEALRFKCNRKSRIAIAFSNEKEEAILESKRAFEQPLIFDNFEIKKIKSTVERIMAYNSAIKSMEDLYVKFDTGEGFYAGLPWFFQFWTRDEAISLKALFNKGKDETLKRILLNRISKVNEDGRLPNRFPFSELGTADGTGWVFKRMYDFILSLKQIEQSIIKKDLFFIKEQLKKSIDYHIESHYEDLLIKNNANETWMDTSYGNDNREGFRIEIQALWLSMLKFMNYLDAYYKQPQEFNALEQQTKQKVRELFFDGSILKDGKDDSTIRPNIFLTFYLYPELLTNEEWEKVFDNSLSKLWLDWGGLSTIDKSNPLFCANYTGEDNKSYHRGDSWFFINNIAAICLYSLNKNKYKEYIEKIIDASTKDMLYNGAIGRPSELSSASSQNAEASIFQLWSVSSYIEMMELFFN